MYLTFQFYLHDFMKTHNLLLSFAKARKLSWRNKRELKSGFCVTFHTLRDENNVGNAKIYHNNRIINNLIRSGSLDSALKVFDEMPERDAVTWNSMISGHYRYGFVWESLILYSQMLSQGIAENSSTFSTVLSVCSSSGLFREGRVVHCRAVVLGFRTNVYIGSALVDLYLRMGLIDIGLKLFGTLQERNLATWNVVLRGVCETGRTGEMFAMCNEMKLDGLVPNGLTFCYLLRGCSCERVLDGGMQLHGCVIKNGLAVSNLFLANALVDFYSVCGSFIDTKKSFDVIPSDDVISWNSMVSVCANNGYPFDALDVFQRMHFYDKKPSVCSFLGFLKLSTTTKSISFGKQTHSCLLKLGFDVDVIVQSSLINMYGKLGDIEGAANLFYSLPHRTLECYNSLMTSLLGSGLLEDVIELFGTMVDENMGYDEVSLSSTLKALSASASSVSFLLLHCCAIKSGFEYDIAVSCSLIDAYSKSGEGESSQKIFNHTPSPNVISFTSIISTRARNGMGFECLQVFNSMIRNSLKPDKVTFLSVLSGCNHSGLVEEGRLLFHQMQTHHGLIPERQHYSCMVDLLGRAGLLQEAEKLIKGSPWQGDPVIWSSILRSCGVHQNKRAGKRAVETLTRLEPENPSVWLQASNFYSEIGDFDAMKEFREITMARRIGREIGQSLIEVRDCW